MASKDKEKNKNPEYICPHCLGRFDYDNFWFQCDLSPKSQAVHDKKSEELQAQIAKGSNSKVKKIRKELGYPESEQDYPDTAIVDDCGHGLFKSFDKHKPDEVPTSGKCYYCGKLATEHICPTCHKPIKIDNNAKQYIVNLAGNKSSGKTIFLGALLYAIYNKLPDIISGWYVEFNEYAKSMCEEFRKFLKGEPCEYYKDGTGQLQSLPAIVTFKRNNRMVSYIFYDIAGESLTSNAPIREKIINANQFSYPDYIILLNDPAQMRGIGADVRGSKADVPDSVKDFFLGEKHIKSADRDKLPRSEDIVFDVSKFIQAIKNYYAETKEEIDTNTKQDIPIAVCLSMIDMLKQLYTESELESKELSFLRSTTYLDDYDLNKFFKQLPKRSARMKKRYQEWRETPIIGAVEQEFSENMFFGVSALGIDYDDIPNNAITDIEGQYRPINVLDPFLWILWRGEGKEIIENSGIKFRFDESDDDDDDESENDNYYDFDDDDE